MAMSLAAMTACVVGVLDEQGVQWSTSVPDAAQGRHSRIFLVLSDAGPAAIDYFRITEACRTTGAPATISGGDFMIELHTLQELRADMEYYLRGPPPCEPESELNRALREAIPQPLLASLVDAVIRNADTDALCRGHTEFAPATRAIARAVQQRLDAYETALCAEQD